MARLVSALTSFAVLISITRATSQILTSSTEDLTTSERLFFGKHKYERGGYYAHGLGHGYGYGHGYGKYCGLLCHKLHKVKHGKYGIIKKAKHVMYGIWRRSNISSTSCSEDFTVAVTYMDTVMDMVLAVAIVTSTATFLITTSILQLDFLACYTSILTTVLATVMATASSVVFSASNYASSRSWNTRSFVRNCTRWSIWSTKSSVVSTDVTMDTARMATVLVTEGMVTVTTVVWNTLLGLPFKKMLYVLKKLGLFYPYGYGHALGFGL